MNELVILSFDSQADADRARATLQEGAAKGIVVLPDFESAIAQARRQRARPASLRGWALLPWHVGAKTLGGALTAVTWTSLIVGAVAGELAGRLLGRDEQDHLRHQVIQAVQTDKVPVILLSRGKASPELIEDIASSSGRVYRTQVSADAAARIRSAFGSD